MKIRVLFIISTSALLTTACAHERVGHSFSVSPVVDRGTPAVAKLAHPDCTWVTRTEASAIVSGLTAQGQVLDGQSVTELFYCCPKGQNRQPTCEKALFPTAERPQREKPEAEAEKPEAKPQSIKERRPF
jgi:hypothetical protein